MNTSVVNSSVALQRCMALAGWEIAHIDLDLTGDQPKAEIKLERCDGRWLLARVDRLGRACFETFQRERALGMSSSTKGRRPLSPQVDDIFLGRQTCLGARHMLRAMTAYIADNATTPVRLEDVRQAWAAVMVAPLRLTASSNIAGIE
jgi:hypothetical protein